jgi:hypothetical protein
MRTKFITQKTLKKIGANFLESIFFKKKAHFFVL